MAFFSMDTKWMHIMEPIVLTCSELSGDYIMDNKEGGVAADAGKFKFCHVPSVRHTPGDSFIKLSVDSTLKHGVLTNLRIYASLLTTSLLILPFT